LVVFLNTDSWTITEAAGRRQVNRLTAAMYIGAGFLSIRRWLG